MARHPQCIETTFVVPVDIRRSRMNSEDKHGVFVARATEIVKENMGDVEFSVSRLSRELHISRVHLHRKLSKIEQKSPSRFIQQIRLHFAAELLISTNKKVSEIGYEVGFRHLSYFAKCFRETYGLSPSGYRKANLS